MTDIRGNRFLFPFYQITFATQRVWRYITLVYHSNGTIVVTLIAVKAQVKSLLLPESINL